MSKPKVVSGGTDVYTIRVRGDKKKQLEPSEHRILFPAGYVSVVRTSDGEYWAHIGVHQELDGDDEKEAGRLVDARIDVVNKPTNQSDVGDLKNPLLYHLAIRVAKADRWIKDEDEEIEDEEN